MGRPLKKQYFGNVTLSGQTIIGNAWINGDTVARPSWIVKQLTSTSYQWLSVDGQGPSTPGQCYLVNGPITGPGQANIAVYPYNAEGGGATAVANLGVYSATVDTSGTGTVTDDYGVGNVLGVLGGTYTTNQQGNVTVASVKVRTTAAAVGGSNYTVGDTFTFTVAGFTTNAILTVAVASATGAVTGLTITNAGVYTGATLPADPVSPNIIVTANASATGATFNIGWGVNTLTIANAGDYRVLPANPVNLVAHGGVGQGATANLTYLVSTVQVTNGGSGFDDTLDGGVAAVTFSTGAATATGSINTAGSVDSVTVTAGGSGYAAIPTVAINPSVTPTLAAEIMDNTVKNFIGQTWSWLPQGYQLPSQTWAHINTQ
jgi:hypothetical protein